MFFWSINNFRCIQKYKKRNHSKNLSKILDIHLNDTCPETTLPTFCKIVLIERQEYDNPRTSFNINANEPIL